jgi:hypothetical protein
MHSQCGSWGNGIDPASDINPRYAAHQWKIREPARTGLSGVADGAALAWGAKSGIADPGALVTPIFNTSSASVPDRQLQPGPPKVGGRSIKVHTDTAASRRAAGRRQPGRAPHGGPA